MPQKPIIAGNWKMNGVKASLEIAKSIAKVEHSDFCRIALFPSATLLSPMCEALKGSGVQIGAQDCHFEDKGAFTGDISATQIKDCGATMVLLGHSERRNGHSEACSLVAKKVRAALRAGLEPLICIGETLEQRKNGQALSVMAAQLKDSLPDELLGNVFHVSYEPVWAIGSGLIPTDDEILEAIGLVRDFLDSRYSGHVEPHVLYGGSVRPENAAHLMSLKHVGGLLVGGASLSLEQFEPIIRAADGVLV